MIMRRGTMHTAMALALVATVATPARAQWRAELAAAARVSDTRPDARVPAGGAVRLAADGRLLSRGPWSLGLAAAAAHDQLAPHRASGDVRAVARLEWTSRARFGLAIDGGWASAWRSARDTTSVFRDSVMPTEPGPGWQSAPARRTVARAGGGVTGAIDLWTRVRGVLVTATARRTHGGGFTESYLATRLQVFDSVEHRPVQIGPDQWIIDTIITKDTVTITERAQRSAQLLQTDLALVSRLQAGRVALALGAGVRQATWGADGDGWVSASATVPLAADVSLVLQAGRLAAEPLRNLPARREAQLGLVLRPWGGVSPSVPAGATPVARRFATRRAADGFVTLYVEAPGARSVEVMGGFSGWRAIALERSGRGEWRLALALPKGVHQVNLRVDGGSWEPPPGMTVADDGFGGRVGLLVID